MMVDVRHEGMAALARDRLKMLVNTNASWSAHSLSTFPGTLSGPAAFLGFTDLSTRFTSHSCTVRMCRSWRQVEIAHLVFDF